MQYVDTCLSHPYGSLSQIVAAKLELPSWIMQVSDLHKDRKCTSYLAVNLQPNQPFVEKTEDLVFGLVFLCYSFTVSFYWS